MQNFPIPKTGKDLQSFLGLLNFFQDFIPNFSKLSHPLDKLRNCGFIHKMWSDECQNNFDALKNVLFQSPILKIPNDKMNFYMQTDASSHAIGCVLFQLKNETISSLNPENCSYIKFASRSLNKTEQKYSATKRELLAIVYGLKKFADYLYGKHFIILCDHKPLSYFEFQDNLGTIYDSWLNVLLKFDFSIQYIPGKLNILPDNLSRLYPDECNSSDKIMHFINLSVEEQKSIREEKLALSLGKKIPNEVEQKEFLMSTIKLTTAVIICFSK